MADSPISSRDRTAGDVRDDLLATKLTVPVARRRRVARSRLLERLDQGLTRKLILVCTPAGFGKTTLLAEWATTTQCPVAWLSLDPQDNDPARFWRYVVAALDRACQGLAEHLLPRFAAPSVLSGQGLATALINQLETVGNERALVIDDYHVIDSNAIHDGMTFLLQNLPPQVHLVVSSRSDPPLPLARLRAAGELVELRAADLRFTFEESAAFLREVWGLNLAPETVTALEARTEGWAVGLQLAALSLRKHADPSVFVADFTGSHRYVLDYLAEEVLERQPNRVRTFLLETSVLERLSGPLCDAVTGGSDGQDMLEELERANLFLVPLDEERRWWRLHHLFRDLLQARLQAAEGDRVADLHMRAATWCEQHGLIDEAIHHALGAGDSRRAARLVEQHLGETLRRGETVVLANWLSALPDEDVRARPTLCLALGLIELHRGHLDAAQRLADHAERAFAQRPAPQGFMVPTDGGMVAEIPAAIALLRAAFVGARGDGEGVAAYARSALAGMTDEEHGPRIWARRLLAGAAWMAGRIADAERAYTELLAEARVARVPYPMMSSCTTLGRLQEAQGKLSAALHTYEDGLRFATEGGRLSAYHAGEAHVGIARVLYERNQLDEALRHATEGLTLCRQVIVLMERGRGLVTLAWIQQALGQTEAALNTMDEACQLNPPDIISLHSPAWAERARLLLAQGRVEEAARWIQECGITEADELSYPRERDYLVLARVLLAQSEPTRALRLLERIDALADSQGRTGNLIEIRALRALALHAAGDHEGALSLLSEALALAQPEGYVRVFADEGAPMVAQLRSLSSHRWADRVAAGSSAVTDHLHRVIAAFDRGPGQMAKAATVAGTIALTDRELEVLHLLAAGQRNRDIARQLVVTLDTVKKHTSHIFDKLGAGNRTEAVDRARRLGILS